MFHLPNSTSRPYLFAVFISLLSAVLCSAAPEGKVPDFTKGEVLNPIHKYELISIKD